ncbi:MAG: SIMPL domain-containing protein [Micropruina sp.]|uniref:SIMPL domain-containing protein n=1 Tax=Micropruina sp. TaxID=2737536 RepID=UPI0039E71AED
MEISVQGSHEETVRPEIARLHAWARAEGGSKNEVLRAATDAVNRLSAELQRLQTSGAVGEVVVRPISTSSWRPMSRGRQQPPIFRADAALRADFTDFVALADLAAQFGAGDNLEFERVEWRLTDDTRRALDEVCLTRAVQQAKERALVMARAAGENTVTFVQLADPGLLGDRARAETFAAAAPYAMARSAMGGEELAGIEIRPEDLTVAGLVQARFITG